MDEKFNELSQRLTQIYQQINASQSPRIRMDMRKMHRAAEKMLTDCSKELVSCRRRGRLTYKYQELTVQTEDTINQLEQYMTLAMLLGD